MQQRHPHADGFIEKMRSTQNAYAERRLEDYLAGFADDYYSVQLHTHWGEDKAQLRAKIEKDIERFEMLKMDFEVLRDWYSGETGFAHLAYHTRLRDSKNGKVLVDRRENIIAGRHLGKGKWELISKIVLKAENYYEE